MSLINDALKKAQSMQPRPPSGPLKLGNKSSSHPKPLGGAASAVAPAAPPPRPSATAAHSGKHASPHGRPGLVLAVAGALFVGAVAVVGVFGYFMWQKGTEATAAATAPAPTPTPAVETVAAPVVVEPAPTPVVATSPEPVATATQSLDAAESAVDDANMLDAPRTRSRLAPSRPRDPRIEAFVLGLKVAGIRSGENPKALLNDKVYAVGEYVSVEFDLKLATVHARTLDLEDSAGNVYEVRF